MIELYTYSLATTFLFGLAGGVKILLRLRLAFSHFDPTYTKSPER
jgi:hypothetical protein